MGQHSYHTGFQDELPYASVEKAYGRCRECYHWLDDHAKGPCILCECSSFRERKIRQKRVK